MAADDTSQQADGQTACEFWSCPGWVDGEGVESGGAGPLSRVPGRWLHPDLTTLA